MGSLYGLALFLLSVPGEKYSIEKVFQLALAAGTEVAQSRLMWVTVLITASVIIAGLGICTLLRIRKLFSLPILIMLAIGLFLWLKNTSDSNVVTISHELANVAITQGVEQARKLQATQEQLIVAPIIQFGTDTINCKVTVNYHGECQSASPYYSSEEFNIRYIEHKSCTTDSKGRESCTTWTERKSDWRYTPWFKKLVRYWVVPDTKAKYLDDRVYTTMQAADPSSHPKVLLHSDWRAPEDAREYIYPGESPFPGTYVDRVPSIWLRSRSAATNGGPIVNAVFVGKYFNWGFASESTDFISYNGHYNELKKLVELPGLYGVEFHYVDAIGQDAVMKTMLNSPDGDLAMAYDPVTFIGFQPSTAMQASFNEKALEFQGHFGPHKEAIARWFIVPDSIVSKLGSLRNVTMAIKAYLNDASVWGPFRLPKNLVILVASISDDGRTITGRDMETGMPYGNVIVTQRMQLSITKGDSIPLNVDNLFGKFSSHYQPSGDGFTYEFSTLEQAGSAIGLLYESTPGWTPPDPNDESCSTAPAEHLGFVRYQMCTQQYRESTIQVNSEGALLIVEEVRKGAAERTPMWFAWVILVVSLAFGGFVLFYSIDTGSRSYRHSVYH